jgi:NAD(P)-dependent dehydrogenase (short-subunit alcohol dehydrogenase family)
LLYGQQSTDTIFRTNLSGTITGSRALSPNRKHTTSVTGDGANYYVSDYTSNTSSPDLYRVDKTTGAAVNMSTDVTAFDDNWSNLKQIRISAVAPLIQLFRRSRWRPTPASAISRSTKPATMSG